MADKPRTPPPRIPSFAPVPVKRRADGWTPLRQCEFIGMLAETGSVSAAAEFVGMARETAYRLRRRRGAEEFAAAWDAAVRLARWRFGWSGGAVFGDDGTPVPPKVTAEALWQRIRDGRWRPVLREGKYAGSVQKADNSALLRFLAQLDRARGAGQAGQRSRPEKTALSRSTAGVPLAQRRPRW